MKVKGEWHMSLALQMAAIVRVGTAVTCDVETKAGKRYTRWATVVRTETLPDGTPRALCAIKAGGAGRAGEQRHSFARLSDGSWGVRLQASASRRVRVGDTLEVAVTAKSGRVAHVTVRVLDIVENDRSDCRSVAEIVERDSARSREPVFDAEHGVTEACPACGTTACDSGVTGPATSRPSSTRASSATSRSRTRRARTSTPTSSPSRAQDGEHSSARIDRGEFVRAVG